MSNRAETAQRVGDAMRALEEEHITPRKAVVDTTELLKVIDTIAQSNLNLGIKMGYRKGWNDKAEGKPWDGEIETLP